MPPKLDLTGLKFGRLTVLREAPRRGNLITWEVSCECGSVVHVRSGNLRSGVSRSCGCSNGAGPRLMGEPEKRLFRQIKKLPSGCWVWQGISMSSGYGIFSLNGEQTSTHRAAWTIFRGEIPSDLFVLHSCDVRLCVNPDHLWLGTREDNTQDMLRKGRQSKGPKHRARCREVALRGEERPSAKLTEEAVRFIRKNYRKRPGHPNLKDLADKFGVQQNAVLRVIHGRTWNHVK